jgi:acyl carrier protein
MTPLSRAEVLETMRFILDKQGKAPEAIDESSRLEALGFRSLDFSELCLRVEDALGKELDFDAARLRRIETVADVCEFLESAGA